MPHGAGPRARPLGTAKDGWEPRGTLTAVTAPRSPRARSGSERRPLPSAAPGWGAACAPIPAYPCPSAAVHSCCGTGLGAALARPPAPPLAPPRRHGVSGAGLGTRGDAGGRVQDHWDMRVPWRPRVGTQRRRMVMETLKRWGQESWGTETRVTGQGALGAKTEEADNIKSSRDPQKILPHRGGQGPRSNKLWRRCIYWNTRTQIWA